MSEEVKVPLIEMDQIAPGDSPEYYLAAVYIDGEMRDRRHSLELHIDTDCDEIIRMMEVFYRMGFEEGTKRTVVEEKPKLIMTRTGLKCPTCGSKPLTSKCPTKCDENH